MSYVTLEVKINHGQIVPSEPDKLPGIGKGYLTILESSENDVTPKPRTPLKALEALQKHLQLDDKKVAEWMATVRDARR